MSEADTMFSTEKIIINGVKLIMAQGVLPFKYEVAKVRL